MGSHFTCCVFLALLVVASGVKLPATFMKCNRKQPDFKDCILKAAGDGLRKLENPVPGLKIPSINPVEVKEVVVGGNGAVAVDQKFHDCKLYGFPSGEVTRFEFDFEKKLLLINATFPEIKKLCQYELDGKILLLPIKGKGASTVVLKTLKADAILNYEEVKRKGKTFIRITKTNLHFDTELVTYNFENLLSTEGSPELGKGINQVLNDNWSEVFSDVKSGYNAVVSTIVTNMLNEFFSRVSMEEAFD